MKTRWLAMQTLLSAHNYGWPYRYGADGEPIVPEVVVSAASGTMQVDTTGGIIVLHNQDLDAAKDLDQIKDIIDNAILAQTMPHGF